MDVDVPTESLNRIHRLPPPTQLRVAATASPARHRRLVDGESGSAPHAADAAAQRPAQPETGAVDGAAAGAAEVVRQGAPHRSRLRQDAQATRQ